MLTELYTIIWKDSPFMLKVHMGLSMLLALGYVGVVAGLHFYVNHHNLSKPEDDLVWILGVVICLIGFFSGFVNRNLSFISYISMWGFQFMYVFRLLVVAQWIYFSGR